MLIKEVHYKNAMTEAGALLPHLEILKAGKGSENDTGGRGSIKDLKRKRADDRPCATAGRITVAAEAFHDWLSQENSALRGMLMLLAGDGAFWSGYAAEKTARSAIKQKLITKQEIVEYAIKRARTDRIEPSASSDASGLLTNRN